MKKVVLTVILTLAVVVGAEGALRVWAYYFRHSYQRFDSQLQVMRLVKNYDATHGVRFRVNSKGFRGEEFQDPKPPGVYRIFAVGDSTTWGVAGKRCPYPEALQYLLNTKNAQPGRQYEVVNAGVEGYNSHDALTVLEKEILQYQPDMVTIYIGWNDLIKYDAGTPGSAPKFARLAYAISDVYLIKAWRKVMFGTIRQRFFTPTTGASPETVERYKSFVPHVYKQNLERMIDLGKSHNVKMVLFTLPSLLHENMTPAQIKMLYFPHYTHNLTVFSLALDRYNETIREVARERDIPLVDLAAQVPGHWDLFFDTAHMECPGGKWVAERIIETLSKAGLLGTPATANGERHVGA